MLFGRKNKEIKCDNCTSNVNDKFNFCPYCGYSMIDEKKELKEFGLLGRDDYKKAKEAEPSLSQFGITNKLISSLMQTMMKSFEQMNNSSEEEFEESSIEQLPNGIRIKIGLPHQHTRPKKENNKTAKKQITEEQLQKLSTFPRTKAKTKIKRLSDKVIYEISAPGIKSPNDVFISKLENGYEIKAIGKNKIYTNSISIDLPIRGFSFTDKDLFIEFKNK